MRAYKETDIDERTEEVREGHGYIIRRCEELAASRAGMLEYVEADMVLSQFGIFGAYIREGKKRTAALQELVNRFQLPEDMVGQELENVGFPATSIAELTGYFEALADIMASTSEARNEFQKAKETLSQSVASLGGAI